MQLNKVLVSALPGDIGYKTFCIFELKFLIIFNMHSFELAPKGNFLYFLLISIEVLVFSWFNF